MDSHSSDHFWGHLHATELSSRPERSAVEGSAVFLPILTQALKPCRLSRERTADPSASLGMTKGRQALTSAGVNEEWRELQVTRDLRSPSTALIQTASL